MIRPETPADYAGIRDVHEAAFAPSTYEADLVDALRTAQDHVPDLCLVAEEGRIVGHVMVSTARIGEHTALALAPIAVATTHQNQGIGSALMRETIRRAQQTDYPLIALLGHPAYYPRFGFEPAQEAFDVTTSYDVPAEAWMALALPAYTSDVRGQLTYAKAFG